MAQARKIFEDAALKKAFDTRHRQTIQFNISRYNTAVVRGKQQYCNLELARMRAANQKYKVINDYEYYLKEFEHHFNSRGGKIIFARDAAEAMEEIIKVLKDNQVKKLVKSKSMITEELEFNEHVEHEQIESLETDLGEYIVQLAGEKPYHIITPVMHKSKEDIAELFHEKFNLAPQSTPEQITAYVRDLLREKFVDADCGVTGANFLVADIGGVCLTENEGNALMSVSFPKLHIAIAGFDKMIPSLKDLHLFWPLLATHGTGQNITVYNSIILGPRQEGETDGPEEMYLVIVDNGRTELLAQVEQRASMTCIRCGACLNGCPIYRNIGGHAYGTVYSGPIGAVITPHLRGMAEYKHLSFASSLCGKCSEVCPMHIELHKLLLYNRRDAVKRSYTTRSDRFVMFGWKKVMMNRWMLDKTSSGLKNQVLKMFFRKAWGPRREIPFIQPKSFNRQWKELKGIK
jgi:L-lactate dehydrogenase complex protein LldF